MNIWAESTGVEPHQFKRELLAALSPEIERRSLLSEEELKAEDLAAQNEYLSNNKSQQQTQMQDIQEMQELEMRFELFKNNMG